MSWLDQWVPAYPGVPALPGGPAYPGDRSGASIHHQGQPEDQNIERATDTASFAVATEVDREEPEEKVESEPEEKAESEPEEKAESEPEEKVESEPEEKVEREPEKKRRLSSSTTVTATSSSAHVVSTTNATRSTSTVGHAGKKAKKKAKVQLDKSAGFKLHLEYVGKRIAKSYATRFERKTYFGTIVNYDPKSKKFVIAFDDDGSIKKVTKHELKSKYLAHYEEEKDKEIKKLSFLTKETISKSPTSFEDRPVVVAKWHEVKHKGEYKYPLLRGTIEEYQRADGNNVDASVSSAASDCKYDPLMRWKVRMSVDVENTIKLGLTRAEYDELNFKYAEVQYMNAVEVEHYSRVYAIYVRSHSSSEGDGCEDG